VTDTPLKRKLQLLIEANGPMTVADYMAHCLGDPVHGYYMTRDPFGAGGDFTTAPEVSQMFGEIVGAWLSEAWRMSGRPSPARLVELGPGRGTLMADILRVTKHAPDFRRAITVHLVETSPALQARQNEALAQPDMAVSWHSHFVDVPDGPLFLVANEFFDALPIRQFVENEGQWRERVIGVGGEGDLVFGYGAAMPQIKPTGFDGAFLELRPAADSLAASIARRIAERGGAALIVDYGHADSAFGDTLQAVTGHRFADPLAAPGEADLTAHVDFAALSQSARAAGAAIHGPMTQRDFLLSLGLLERACRLGANADNEAQAMLNAAIDRLTGSDQMGALFKVLALTQDGVQPPPFPSKAV